MSRKNNKSLMEYRYPPRNLEVVDRYIVRKPESITKILLKANECIFYDTCSFRYHSKLSDYTDIISYIVEHGSMVILTSTVLSELTCNEDVLNDKEISYIKSMYEKGIKVVFMQEELAVDILRTCYSKTEKINSLLGDAIKNVLPTDSKCREYIKNSSVYYNVYYRGVASSDTVLGKDLIREMRGLKCEDDDLAELLIAICIYLIMNCPHDSYKIFVFTDDKMAIKLMGKTSKRLPETKECLAISTPKLCWLLAKSGAFVGRESIEIFLDKIYGDRLMKITCSGEYDMAPSDKLYNVKELAELISNNSCFKIYV